ncbi:MAG: hypothetical protein KUG78_14540 [Kangiellaceae bacterium]|nr:hypothetical protein [Kangiellaceae bacterium]
MKEDLNLDSFESMILEFEILLGQKVDAKLVTELEKICKTYPKFLAYYFSECMGLSIIEALRLYLQRYYGNKQKPLKKIIHKLKKNRRFPTLLAILMMFLTAPKKPKLSDETARSSVDTTNETNADAIAEIERNMVIMDRVKRKNKRGR